MHKEFQRVEPTRAIQQRLHTNIATKTTIRKRPGRYAPLKLGLAPIHLPVNAKYLGFIVNGTVQFNLTSTLVPAGVIAGLCAAAIFVEVYIGHGSTGDCCSCNCVCGARSIVQWQRKKVTST